ncbi:hypothetical protein HYV50_05555 [Candidatus Pacearchaeota archaeon]|nr:hypothetical protein [Candidatus Pacearchaeota archaeon]
MGWKDLPHWARYGVYGAIIYAILFNLLFSIPGEVENLSSIIQSIFLIVIFFLSLPNAVIHELFYVSNPVLDKIIVPMIAGFILGAIIGWIASKATSKDKNRGKSNGF